MANQNILRLQCAPLIAALQPKFASMSPAAKAAFNRCKRHLRNSKLTASDLFDLRALKDVYCG